MQVLVEGLKKRVAGQARKQKFKVGAKRRPFEQAVQLLTFPWQLVQLLLQSLQTLLIDTWLLAHRLMQLELLI
jgi:hypothetical protein